MKAYINYKNVPLRMEFVKERLWYRSYLATVNNGKKVIKAQVSLGLKDSPSLEAVTVVLLHELGHLEEYLSASPSFFDKLTEIKFRRSLFGVTKRVLSFLAKREAVAWANALCLSQKYELGITSEDFFSTLTFCLTINTEIAGIDYLVLFLKNFITEVRKRFKKERREGNEMS